MEVIKLFVIIIEAMVKGLPSCLLRSTRQRRQDPTLHFPAAVPYGSPCSRLLSSLLLSKKNEKILIWYKIVDTKHSMNFFEDPL